MKKRILALLAAGIMLLTGCGAQNAAQSDAANSGSDDLQHLTVVLDWYPNALHAFLYEAQEKGYFAEEGLDVDIQSPAGVNDAMSMVAAGKADIGLYYQQDVIQARAEQDVPIKSIGAVVQGPLNIILSLKDKNITTPKDLEGKTVGYAGTELSEALIRSIMQSNGADPNSVNMVDVGFDLMSSMTTGNVDATIGCLVNHEVPQMEKEGFEMIPYEKETFDFSKPLAFDTVTEFREKYDAVIYLGNVENASNKTTNRINWYTLFGLGNNMPWFVKEVPTLFVSLQNPYHIIDVPMISTYINCYSNHDVVLEELVRKLVGKDTFRGVSPVDPFCGKEYLKS